jgi:nucleotide-binding universal stress UspA family protein
MYRHILIPTDGSPLSDEAVTHGVALAAETGARVSFLIVTEPFRTFSFGVDQLEDTGHLSPAHEGPCHGHPDKGRQGRRGCSRDA